MFFLQMSGFPGSGKSTLSRQVAERTEAVIIDHDIVKSALMENLTGDTKIAGRVSYNIDWSLIDFQLSQERSVIFDSPCLYQEMIDKGINLSKKYHVKYKYVECYLDDFYEINDRLQNRKRMISQIEEVTSEGSFKYTIENSKKPNDYPYLVVDTRRPLKSYLTEVINYIKE